MLETTQLVVGWANSVDTQVHLTVNVIANNALTFLAKPKLVSLGNTALKLFSHRQLFIHRASTASVRLVILLFPAYRGCARFSGLPPWMGQSDAVRPFSYMRERRLEPAEAWARASGIY